MTLKTPQEWADAWEGYTDEECAIDLVKAVREEFAREAAAKLRAKACEPAPACRDGFEQGLTYGLIRAADLVADLTGTTRIIGSGILGQPHRRVVEALARNSSEIPNSSPAQEQPPASTQQLQYCCDLASRGHRDGCPGRLGPIEVPEPPR